VFWGRWSLSKRVLGWAPLFVALSAVETSVPEVALRRSPSRRSSPGGPQAGTLLLAHVRIAIDSQCRRSISLAIHKLTLLVLLILSSVFAASAQAGVLYDFNFIQGAGTQVQNFEFSFIAPTFVTSGQSPAFTPFTITDGTHTSTMTEDLIGLSAGTGCFDFGSGADVIIGNCSLSAPGPTGGVISFNLSAGLPSTTGVFDAIVNGGFYVNSSTIAFAGGNATLTVSNVPEPASGVLVLAAVGLFGWRFRRSSTLATLR
jgi:hypothetical protein